MNSQMMILLDASMQYGLLAQAGMAAIGFAIFIAYFVTSYNVKGRLYQYSCPLSAMWMGLVTLWFTLLLLAWWRLSKSKSSVLMKVWTTICALIALEGFVCLVSFAAGKNEGAAAALSLLWIASGTLGVVMCVARQRTPEEETDSTTPLEDASAESRPKERYARVCCSLQFWLNFCILFPIAWLLAFSTGVTVQAAAAANDSNSIQPPGNVHTITANGVDLDLHLYCFGDSAGKTVVFEHGGGANSLTLLGLAEEAVSKHGARACLYDRLGYGFSPSLYAGADALPNSGRLLSLLLDKAGESGPFVCVGHSAGAGACLLFAHENKAVVGVAMLDGYPDLIRAGSVRPGQEPNSAVLGAVQGLGVVAGAPGLARGVIGDPGGSFVPESRRGTVTALYAQTRFWLAQYWDVKAELALEDERQLYRLLRGSKHDDGLVRYGGTLAGVTVLVVPAHSTSTDTDCGLDENKGVYCCGHAFNSTICQNERADSAQYAAQARLYAETLSADTNGTVVVAPAGTDHGFVWHRDFYQWTAGVIAQALLK